MLQSIGWLDKNMNANKKLIASDITRYINLKNISRFVPNKALDYRVAQQNTENIQTKNTEKFLRSLDPVVTAPLVGGHRVCIAMVMDEVEGHE